MSIDVDKIGRTLNVILSCENPKPCRLCVATAQHLMQQLRATERPASPVPGDPPPPQE